jgi:hypothetical protein
MNQRDRSGAMPWGCACSAGNVLTWLCIDLNYVLWILMFEAPA